jgi:hypothetical protein
MTNILLLVDQGMTIPERVVEFLNRNRGIAFCDACIADRVGLAGPTSAQLVTKTLALCSDYTRTEAKCGSCQRTRLLTKRK